MIVNSEKFTFFFKYNVRSNHFPTNKKKFLITYHEIRKSDSKKNLDNEIIHYFSHIFI